MKSKKSKNEKIKQQHNVSDIKTTIVLLAGAVLLVLPMVFLVLTNYLWLDAPESAWIVIGFIGALAIGIGLFNAILSLNKAHLRIKFTLICLLCGIVLIAISELLVYHSYLFNEILVIYCLMTVLFSISTLICYAVFRAGIQTYLRISKRLSKTNINKHKKGFRNYLWYEEIHSEFGIGKLYYLNKGYTILFSVNLFVNLIFGFFKITSIFTCSLSILLYILATVIGLYGAMKHHLEEYGKTFVLFRRDRLGKIDSSFFDLFYIVFPIAMAYIHLKMTIGLWQ